MHIKNILKGIKYKAGRGVSSLKINTVTCDSRKVKKGDLFIAFRGYSVDGYKFIGEAASRGAAIILAQRDFAGPESVKKILVKDTRRALPVIAANFYKHPSDKLKVIGITGTNGKTTITYIIENILRHAGRETGVIGTINYRFAGKEFPAKNTTPGPLELEAILADMVKQGIRYAIMEVSSHSLDQGRADGLTFDEAIFTNISGEHLDYHKTIKRYFNAKIRLFDKLKAGGAAILNNDDKKISALRHSLKNKVITYGLKSGADIRAVDIKLGLDGSAFTAIMPNGSFAVKTRLIGKHNISNILAAIAVAFIERTDLSIIKKGIESTSFAPGRLEPIDERQPFKVFVDYAHTEDALRNILSILREVRPANRIITVFGCGGDRDRKKRPRMGVAACEFSDRVMITSDNPRFEEPLEIIKEIEKGVKGAFDNYDIIADRKAAIKAALSEASENDIVVIAGKGHEKYQIIKDRAMPFDDCEVARSVLNKLVTRK